MLVSKIKAIAGRVQTKDADFYQKYKGYLINATSNGDLVIQRARKGTEKNPIWENFLNKRFDTVGQAKAYIDSYLPAQTTDASPDQLRQQLAATQRQLEMMKRNGGDREDIREAEQEIEELQKKLAGTKDEFMYMYGRTPAQVAKRESEFDFETKRRNLLSKSDKDNQAAKFSLEEAKRFIDYMRAVPGDDPKAREALKRRFPGLDITKDSHSGKSLRYQIKDDKLVKLKDCLKAVKDTQDVAPGDVINIRSEYGGLKGVVSIVGSDYLTGKYQNSTKMFTVKKQPEGGEYVPMTYPKDSTGAFTQGEAEAKDMTVVEYLSQKTKTFNPGKDALTLDPLTAKGKKILQAMIKNYGEKKGKEVFYASKNKGTIEGVDAAPELNDKIIAFFKANPTPDDEAVHAFAEEQGINTHELKTAIYGLLSSRLSVGKHNDVPDDQFDVQELARGIEVEQEHTSDPEVAKSIAKDHLMEIADYYTRLDQMERQAKTKDGSFRGSINIKEEK